MCIACELGFWIAMDELPDGPPPGFPPPRQPLNDIARFSCDAPQDDDSAAPSRKDERTP
jgi:hypothetical protein